MTSAFIHIGMPKTGTTAIQRHLHAVSSRLAEAGVFFRRFRRRSLSQIEIAIVGLAALNQPIPDQTYAAILGLADPAALQGFAQRFDGWLTAALAERPYDTAVFSSEHIYYWINSPALIAATDAWLRRHFSDVHYVIYLREPVKFVPSLYSQMLRDGREWTLDDFLAHNSDHDIARLLNDWATTLGADRLKVRLLEPDFLTGGTLLEDFQSLLQVKTVIPTSQRRDNAALPASLVPFAIRLNARLNRYVGDARVRKVLRDACLRLAEVFADPAPILLAPEQIALIHQRNRARHEAVRAAFFPERATLFAGA